MGANQAVFPIAAMAELPEVPPASAGGKATEGGGERHGHKRIAQLMRAAGLVGASRRRMGVTTTRRNRDARPAPDLVDRKFAATTANELWVADITFVPTAAGFLFLAVVLDACSRKIVGGTGLKVPSA